ncbi:MAG: aldo/keto reductase [Chloroflexi bacterium]|nr:aldo/keto reductase [Chloroflexota bacterium]OJV94505.1 MAG: alcohol dehydrogenase [Chloroflexi bacterium 54-19]
MKIKRLGRTGLKVSEICLGTMTFGNQADEKTSFAIMDTAWEGGVFFFDTADVYPLGSTPEMRGRTEEYVGNWIKERKRRDQVVLATKCRGAMGEGPNDSGLSRKYIISAVEASLKRLQTDYIDLYQVHSPDLETPIEETMEALDSLVKAGKVRYIGCSNYQAYQLGKALWVSDKKGIARFESDQPRYNILYREIENEVLPLCKEEGLGVIAYNPLAGGFLTGRYKPGQDVEAGTRFSLHSAGKMYQNRYWKEAQFEVVEQLRKFFEARQRSLAQVALAWVLAQPVITSAILGASRPEQLHETLAATELQLTQEEMDFANDAWFNLPRAKDPSVALR